MFSKAFATSVAFASVTAFAFAAQESNAQPTYQLIGDYSPKIKDLVLAHGELLSVKMVANLLASKNVTANIVDARNPFLKNS